MALVTNGQTTTQNGKGEALAYGGVTIAAGGVQAVAQIISAVAHDSVKLNLSLPNATDWSNSWFNVYHNDTLVLTIVDESAQFIGQPWRVPFDIKAGDTVKVKGANGSLGALRFAAYLGLSNG